MNKTWAISSLISFLTSDDIGDSTLMRVGFFEQRVLFVRQQPCVTDNVDEQDVPDVEFHVWGLLGRHATSFYLETQALTSRISRRLRISILDACCPITLNI